MELAQYMGQKMNAGQLFLIRLSDIFYAKLSIENGHTFTSDKTGVTFNV